MDTEQQVRLNFLEEAEDYLDRIESVLLNLSRTGAAPEAMDVALRAAHSLKGGAATMGFKPMSQIAHRLEDFLKILRVRPEHKVVSPEVETLLLQGLDCLRKVGDMHRQGTEINEVWLSNQTQPIFSGLMSQLGELTAADEDALLVQDGGKETALLVFEGGVDSVMEHLQAQLDTLSGDALSQEVAIAAEQLAEYGRMVQISPFVEVCQTVRQQLGAVSESQIQSYARRVFELWQRASAMVLLEQTEQLDGLRDLMGEGGIAVSNAQPTATNPDISPDFNAGDFAEIEAAFEQFEPEGLDELVDLAEFPAQELAAAATNEGVAELTEDIAADEVEVQEEGEKLSPHLAVPPGQHQALMYQPAVSNSSTDPASSTLRIPVEQLRQANSLFGKLVLERNAINLRLKQAIGLARSIGQRLHKLEKSNTQLRKWEDRAMLEGALPKKRELPLPTPSPRIATEMEPDSQNLATRTNNTTSLFDVLEMDRYSDLHLLCQTQMENIQQLKEVSADIDLVLREMAQFSTELNQTTRTLQQSVTRMQMCPFADVVKRFPRTIRDLSRHYNKPVNLVLEGEETPIDRAILNSLSDPLMHLIRNAFDHGIESSEERINTGKSSFGTIAISAANRGKTTAITVKDDGRGIDLETIRVRALQMGLPETELKQSSDSELLELIFEPGFSTAGNVTELSGRGIGMDVVRSNVAAVRGSIRIDSQPGQGTSFTIEVPLMISVLRVVLLETGGMVFAVPAQTVRKVVHLHAETLRQLEGREQILLDKSIIPLIRLDRNLQFPHSGKPIAMEGTPKVNRPTAVIFHQLESLGGLHIQRIWREEEVSTMTVNSPVKLPPGFGSATILGDGRVIPLIDPAQLLPWVIQNPFGLSKANSVTPATPSYEKSDIQTNTILIVDDSITVRSFLATTLEKAGYRVEQAKNGQEALDMLLGGLSISAVISDIEMPRLNGYGLLFELRSRPEFEHLPITILTSRSGEKHRKLATRLGASAYLSKPYTERELLETIAGLLGNACAL